MSIIVSAMCIHISCAIGIKYSLWLLTAQGSCFSAVDIARLAFRRGLSFHFRFSFADDCHFLIIVPIDFRSLPDLIHCHPTVKFKHIYHTSYYSIFSQHKTSCSSNVVAEGIGAQA